MFRTPTMKAGTHGKKMQTTGMQRWAMIQTRFIAKLCVLIQRNYLQFSLAILYWISHAETEISRKEWLKMKQGLLLLITARE